MNEASLRRMVSTGEGPAFEFKRSTGELREGMEALCAMLNAQGRGRIVFGISDKGEIVGQAVAEGTQRDIANASRRIEPAAEIKTSVIRLGHGRAVVVVEAVAHGEGPFTFEGRGYLRVGNTTQRMSHSEFDRRVVDRLENEVPWDRWIVPDWKIRDLDRAEIQRTVEDAVEAKRLTGVLGEKIEVVLRGLELVTDRGVTRAAAIVFGKEGGCTNGQWLELAAKREKDHPGDALPVYQARIEPTVVQTNNDAYHQAVGLLRKVHSLMSRLGSEAEFARYLETVRVAHKPRRNFMKLLERAKWK